VLWGDGQGRWFAVNETANIVRPYPYLYELQKNSYKIENVEVQKSGVSDFCKTKKIR